MKGRERDKHRCERETRLAISCVRPSRDGACYPGTRPDWNGTGDLSLSRMTLQPTEPHWPGLFWLCFEQYRYLSYMIMHTIKALDNKRKFQFKLWFF